MIKKITTTGFYGTGSSAITDILKDCSNVLVKSDYEVRILHDPYGVSDLEYNLIGNSNRHNTSNAIKKFEYIVKWLNGNKIVRRYNEYFNNQFLKVSLDYIDEITEFKYYGKWHYDLIEKGKIIYFLSRSYNKIFQIINKIFKINNEVGYDLLSKNELAYAGTFDSNKFLNATKKYTNRLFDAVNKEKYDYVLMDQLVPPNNFMRFSRYFDNITIFVVDRDPRDIYLLEKYEWHGTVVPYYDIDKYCKWYKWTRKQFENSKIPKNVKKIQFEDLIYNFEKTRDEILKIAGIDKKHYKIKNFNPKVSKKNTRLWEKYNDVNIQIIEKKLANYCYDYKKL